MLNKQKKDKIIKKYQTHPGDTGSPQVQIAILSSEIQELSDHLQQHKKDHSSRRGLLRKVTQRRKLLQYLMREDDQAYEELIRALKMKKQISQFEQLRAKLAEEEILSDTLDEEEDVDESEDDKDAEE